MIYANLMLTASYITKGFFEAVLPSALDKTKIKRHFGEVEVVAWLNDFAWLIEKVWDEADEPDASGVWVYEVAEPFGRYVASVVNETGDFPDAAVAQIVAETYAEECLK